MRSWPTNGGGLGAGKSDFFQITRSWFASFPMLTGRPVKCTLDSEETVFLCHRGRHPVLMQIKTGREKGRRDHRVHFKYLFLDGLGGHMAATRLPLATVASTFDTAACKTVTYEVPPPYKVSGLRASPTNRRVVVHTRGARHAAPRYALEVHLSTKSPRSCGIGPRLRCAWKQSKSSQIQSCQLSADGKHWVLGACIDKVVGGRLEKQISRGWMSKREPVADRVKTRKTPPPPSHQGREPNGNRSFITERD